MAKVSYIIGTYLPVLLLFAACAAPSRYSERRVPRGWTIDATKQDLRAVNVREQKAFGEGKIIRTDNFSAEKLTQEASLSSASGPDRLKMLIDDHNKLRCINSALEDAIEAAEDRRCFARVRTPSMLEVHVATAIGALRDARHWPQFTVEIGGEDNKEFPSAYVLDGGTVVFRKIFAAPHYFNMEELIKKIELILTTEPSDKLKNTGYINGYLEFEEGFGKYFCAEDSLWGLDCKRHDQLKEKVMIEKNRVLINKIEIYLRYKNDDRLYKIFSSRNRNNNPLTILDNSVRNYLVNNFKNNPHWVLHNYSARCEPWGDANHDGSDFGEYIWGNYIAKNSPAAVDVRRALNCPSGVPIYVVPSIPAEDVEDVSAWLSEQEFVLAAEDASCQVRTAETIKGEELKKFAKGSKCTDASVELLAQPADIDTWDATRIREAVQNMGRENSTLK